MKRVNGTHLGIAVLALFFTAQCYGTDLFTNLKILSLVE